MTKYNGQFIDLSSMINDLKCKTSFYYCYFKPDISTLIKQNPLTIHTHEKRKYQNQ